MLNISNRNKQDYRLRHLDNDAPTTTQVEQVSAYYAKSVEFLPIIDVSNMLAHCISITLANYVEAAVHRPIVNPLHFIAR